MLPSLPDVVESTVTVRKASKFYSTSPSSVSAVVAAQSQRTTHQGLRHAQLLFLAAVARVGGTLPLRDAEHIGRASHLRAHCLARIERSQERVEEHCTGTGRAYIRQLGVVVMSGMGRGRAGTRPTFAQVGEEGDVDGRVWCDCVLRVR